MRSALHKLRRYIATPLVSKHRIFVWLPPAVLPANLVVAIAKDDDLTFGVLQSRFHGRWALRLCTWMGVGNDPRYTPTSTFETFPFPDGLTPNIPSANYTADQRTISIAEAACCLNQLRENWLNPPELVNRVPEIVPCYPDRLLPVNDKAAQELKKRTLTNLYNQRPAWLVQAHERLDAAVAAAYGWPADISEEEALKRLLELNLSRSAAQSS
jgi:type II restriction/modification system DNA methylase subunit YeeA